MRPQLAGAALLALLPAVAYAAGADRDGDGRITREELQAVHASLFEQLDANKDGIVGANEADPHFLDIADQNRDGQVTKDENEIYAAEAAAADLANCDANQDDALSGEEIACITSSDSFQ